MVRSHRNVYAVGGQIRPPGPIEGDFVAGAARVIVDQPIGGDATLAGGAVDVRAPVGDDLRAMGGDVSIESSIGGELFASGGNVTLRPGASVAGVANIYAGTIDVQGRIDGPLRASGRRIKINGEVQGDVHLTAERIELGPQARIGGSLRYASETELRRSEGATVAGAILRERADAPPASPREPRTVARDADGGLGIAAGVMSYLALLACAAVFLLVAPAFGPQAAQRVRTAPLPALAIGFGALVALPVLAVLLFITLLGIPLGIAVLALYPVLLLAGFVVGVLFLAGLMPHALRKPPPATFGATMGWFAAALLLVLLLARLPVAGVVVLGLVSVAGMGACMLELYGRRQTGGPAAGPGGAAVGATHRGNAL